MLAMMLLACCLNAPPEVTVDIDAMSLAQIVPIPKADPRASVAMGYAPSPGSARRISRQEITARIQAAGLTVDGLEFPESILVRRRSMTLNPEQVKQAIFTAFLKQFPNGNVDVVSVEAPATDVGTGDVAVSA